MNSKYQMKNSGASKRGALIAGTWYCDCDPRFPADKFQTKNGGKNHGRWFYTCQKAQIKRCGFFLWADDAKVREESAVLNNSRSEPNAQSPQTPRRTIATAQQPQTPDTGAQAKAPAEVNAKTINLEHEDSFDWSSSADDELVETAQRLSNQSPPVGSSRKAARTELFSSPGKRSHSNMIGTGSTWGDIFTTPNASSRTHGLLSPVDTPSKGPSQVDIGLAPHFEPCTLASDVLKVLEPIHLPSHVENELIELLNRQDLRMQGIAKGRDIARVVIQAKEKRIAELQARITGLEAERETSKAVIACLKQDIATSPTKMPRRRSES